MPQSPAVGITRYEKVFFTLLFLIFYFLTFIFRSLFLGKVFQIYQKIVSKYPLFLCSSDQGFTHHSTLLLDLLF